VSRPDAQIARIVPNIRGELPAESRTFYEDVVGLDLAMDMGWVVTFVSPGNPAAQISVVREDPTAGVHPDLSIEVEDVGAVHREAVGRGYEIVHPLTEEPWGVRRFFVRDPNGAIVNVLEHIPS
jgi:catechol 2,3-dioxygenase-like lactoylglutathione lyase family enzyme